MLNDDIKQTIEELKHSDINGCITGSCLLPDDFDLWDEVPDIDIFTYGERYMVAALCELVYRMGFKWGIDDHEVSGKQEKQKFEWLMMGRKNKMESALQTVKVHKGGVIVNVSNRAHQTSVSDVLTAFDMTIIMRGYDIRLGVEIDYTTMWCDAHTAILNPLRKQDTDMWVVAKWVRQFDRCIKYWSRGYDTRPAARQYVKMIDEFLERGALWTSEKAMEAYNAFAEEFVAQRDKMVAWLADKEDC